MGGNGRISDNQTAGKRSDQRRFDPGRRRLLWASVAFFASVALVVALTALGVDHH